MKRSTPLVHLLLLNWNTEQHTLACLASLKDVTYPHYKILVLDNASTDGSPEVIAAAYPDVDLIRLPRNLGFTGANNIGFEIALGQGADFVYLLNADTYVSPDFLTEAINTVLSDVTIGIVGSKVLHMHRPDTLQSAGQFVNLTSGYNGRLLGHNEIDNGQYDHVSDVDLIGGCAMMVSRKCLEDIGGFDDAFFAFKEDFDLCLRAKTAGFRVVTSPLSRIWHEGGGSLGKQVSATHMYYSVRNGLLLVEKHKPASNKAFSYARAVCIAGAHTAQVILRGPSFAAFREILRGVHDYYLGVTHARPSH